MSAYTTVEEVREALPLSSNVSNADFADLITQISNSFDIVMGGISFDGPPLTVPRTGDGRDRLFLPLPGADPSGAMTVVEGGVTLDSSLYELDPVMGLYLTRFTDTGQPGTWPTAYRGITVSLVPARCPPAIRNRCTVEVVRAFRSQQMGFAKTIGTPGVSQLVYEAGLEQATIALLERYRFLLGSGGPGRVTM